MPDPDNYDREGEQERIHEARAEMDGERAGLCRCAWCRRPVIDGGCVNPDGVIFCSPRCLRLHKARRG